MKDIQKGPYSVSLAGRQQAIRTVFVLILMIFLLGPPVAAHSPTLDADLSDWCLGTNSNQGGGRTEDSAQNLICGFCSTTTDLACEVDADCPGTQTCTNLTSKDEIVWWDNRTDGAVNDLGSVAVTQDDQYLYIAAELWVDPDPSSLPFGQLAIDYAQGGLDVWDDPNNRLRAPGNCDISTDRACVTEADCNFCVASTEPTGACSVTTTIPCALDSQCPGIETCVSRIRTCGSGCDSGDTCDTSQTCINLGGVKQGLGRNSGPGSLADFLLVFDFSFWFLDSGDAVLLMQPGTTLDPDSPWDMVTGCLDDTAGVDGVCAGSPHTLCANDFECFPGSGPCIFGVCDFEPQVNPGQSGGSGGPPGAIEVAVPWCSFGCTDCPENPTTPGFDDCGDATLNTGCVCSGFGPNQAFRYNLMVARGTQTEDFTVDGGIEDVMSETDGGVYTTSTDDCSGFGIGNTRCELGDGSQDAMVPLTPALAHEAGSGGRLFDLQVTKVGGSIQLDWGQSCAAGDSQYGVYEGTIGTWYDHLPVIGFCTVAGTTTTFVPGTGDQYYIVVPGNGSTEGSYGVDSQSAERPVSTSTCGAQSQSIGTCP
jgi:hypothetical protein